jgi:hypothetical protein
MCIMVAMDDMMSAKDFNMNLVAITPGLIVSYVPSVSFVSCYMPYLSSVRAKKTYAASRKIPKDIERLLVMRDSLPKSPSLPSLRHTWKRSTVNLVSCESTIKEWLSFFFMNADQPCGVIEGAFQSMQKLKRNKKISRKCWRKWWVTRVSNYSKSR